MTPFLLLVQRTSSHYCINNGIYYILLFYYYKWAYHCQLLYFSVSQICRLFQHCPQCPCGPAVDLSCTDSMELTWDDKGDLVRQIQGRANFAIAEITMHWSFEKLC